MSQLRQRPLDAALLEALRQHCEVAKDPATWAEALEHHARAAESADADPVALGRLHFELGNLYRDHLRRLDRAVQHYRAAADSDPAQRPAMAAARALFAEAGKWDQVARLAELEAESLPRGPRRAQLLAELAEVLKTQLDNLPAALDALRDAIASEGSDLGIRHQLATLLLDLADRDGDAALAHAHARREEAAQTLADMAARVSDDYAFAYVEAALDASPSHRAALDVLESVAPRIGREDAVATRWVAALQHTPGAPAAREIRLKLARAYELAGQLDDARVCLEPIATHDDPEARAMLAGLGVTSPKEFSLFESDDPFPESAHSLAEELAALTAADDSKQVPLTDLSALTDRQGSAAAKPPSESPAMLETEGEDEEEILTAPGVPEMLRDVIAMSNAAAEARGATRAASDLARAELPADEQADEPDPTATRVDVSAIAEVPAEDSSDLVPTSVLDDEPTRVAEHVAIGDDVEEVTPVRGQSTEEVLSAVGTAESAAELAENDLEELTSPPAEERSEASATLSATLAELEDEDDDAAEVDDEELTREPTAPRASIPQAALILDAPQPALSAQSQRPQAEPAPLPEPVDELTALRNDLERRLKFRDRRGAAEVAERILALGELDHGAVAALEEHYRTTRDFRRMRDLAMRIADAPESDEDERASRLREAAMLSESKLGDVEGTARALAALLEMLPGDEEAYGKLKRMFLRLGRFDDLAKLLAQTAEVLSTPEEQAARYRELYALHRDKRRSPPEAIEALERARSLDPGQTSDVVELYELYRTVGRFPDAVDLLRARIDEIEEPVERVPLLGELAELIETRIGDADAAYEVNSELLRIAPRHADSLDRAARIEADQKRFDLLVETLRKKLEGVDGAARLPLLLQIADITVSELSAPAEAAEVLSEALLLAPQDRALWQRAALAFDAADRASEFDERLSTVLAQGRDHGLRFDVGAMLAERRERAEDLPGAIAAREAQLALRRDELVLVSLVGLLRRADRTSDLARRLDDLARMVAPDVARGLRLERAALLGERLQNPEAAKSELERILSDLAPDDPDVLNELMELSRRTDDVPRRVRAQERLLHVTRELEQRIELAEDLVDVYERVLNDNDSALRVLRLWSDFDRGNPRPRMRLLPLLEARNERSELVATLDSLAALAISDEEAGEYIQRAARVAMDLADYDGAWNRLVPRVVESADAGAEMLLAQLALRAQRGEQLAELYVGLAQRAPNVEGQKARWTAAASVYDSMVGDPARALEAALRAFAKDLDDPALLSEVDRLAEACRADKRLTQVYDSLVRRAATPAQRAKLLMRHAQLLEERFADPGQALARAVLAFQVDPGDEHAYEEGIRLAERAALPAEKLRLHELRADTAKTANARIDALVAACVVSAQELSDRARAEELMKRTVASVHGDDAFCDRVEHGVASIEANSPDGNKSLLRALADAYRKRADELREPRVASALYARAGRLLRRELDDTLGAFQQLALASRATPDNTALLDELGDIAPRANLSEALAGHLDNLAREALDSNTAVEALRRLGALYEGPLANPARAADTYEEEVKLRPNDRVAHARLRNCLRQAARYKDLLVAIDRELVLGAPAEERAVLLREAAETWELALHNRFEARDAYRKALALVPEDEIVRAALERLSKRTSVDDALLLDGDLTVRPEDLRPSLPIEPFETAAAPDEALAMADHGADEGHDESNDQLETAQAFAAEVALHTEAQPQPEGESLAYAEPAADDADTAEAHGAEASEDGSTSAEAAQTMPDDAASLAEAPDEQADAPGDDDRLDESEDQPSAAAVTQESSGGAADQEPAAHDDEAGPALSLVRDAAEADPDSGEVATDEARDDGEYADEPTGAPDSFAASEQDESSADVEASGEHEISHAEAAAPAEDQQSQQGEAEQAESAAREEPAAQADQPFPAHDDVGEAAAAESATAEASAERDEPLSDDLSALDDDEELEELDADLEELEMSEAPADDRDGGLDALSDMVARPGAAAGVPGVRKVPPPPPRAASTPRGSLASQPPTSFPLANGSSPPPPPRRS